MFIDKVLKETDNEIIEISTLVPFFHTELVEFSKTMRFITASEKGLSYSFPAILISFKLCTDASQLINSLLLAPPTPKDVCHFLTEDLVLKKQLSHGLLHYRLNCVLLRDELRRLFSLLHVNFSIDCVVQLEKYLLNTIGDHDTILVFLFVLFHLV